MNERIDVLAVMDTDGRAVALVADGCVGLRKKQWERHLVIHDEARAAVAELIEAADGVDATHGPMLNGAVDPKVQQLAIDRLRAALARVVSP